MSKQILSETVIIKKPENITTGAIENLLTDKVGEVLRWAIIEAGVNTLKICVTFEKDEEHSC